jgi:membrane-bound inhibitor of C-type lysozyme
MKKLFITLIVLIAILVGLWLFAMRHASPEVRNGIKTNTPTAQGIEVSYSCSANKTIVATFYDGPTVKPMVADAPPIPGGSVHLVLSDGRVLDLKQTISADGVRYSNSNPAIAAGTAGAETFVFWSKGNGALVLENNEQKSYVGCVKVSANMALSQVYSDPAGAFSIRLPSDYTADAKYMYQVDPQHVIYGVKFTIPKSLATGTNLSSDSYISVEQIPNTKTNSQACDASLFLDGGNQVTTKTEDGVTYSVSSAQNAGAGNRYEETVYAIPGTSPCIAARYLIHYGVYQNYPPETTKEFNKEALTKTFDEIRQTLVVNQ